MVDSEERSFSQADIDRVFALGFNVRNTLPAIVMDGISDVAEVKRYIDLLGKYDTGDNDIAQKRKALISEYEHRVGEKYEQG